MSNKNRLLELMGVPNIITKKTKLNEDIVIDNLHITDSEVSEIFEGYVEASLWTEEEQLNDMIQNNSEYEYLQDDDDSYAQKEFIKLLKNKSTDLIVIDNIDDDSKIQAYLDIKKFIIDSGSDAIKEAVNENGYKTLGVNIWLTRNRHGSGFSDYWYENEKQLINAAINLKEVDLYIGDDNKLYYSNAN